MTSFFVGLFSAAASGTAVWLFFHAWSGGLRERLKSKEEEVAALTSELEKTRKESSQLSTQRTQLATKLEAEREAHDRLINEFKALSADALRANRADFLEQAKQTFALLQQQSAGDLEKRQQAIDSLVKPLRESLEKVDGKISEIEKARASAYGALGEQLKALTVAQLQLQNEASRLSTALRSTSYAGSWGEFQLRRVVEMADMLPFCDFTEQESSGGLRADLVVRLPGGQRIVVDAKAPLESYRAAGDTTEEQIRAARLKDHALKIRGHVDVLGAKNYWEQFQPSPEFVVLFLPGDHLLTAALQTDSSLMDRALTRRVLLATPTTLIALLKAAAYGWRQESVSNNTEEISTLGRQLYDRAATFAENLEKIGHGLESAVKGFNLAVGTFDSSLMPNLRKFAQLGIKGSKSLTDSTSKIKEPIREIKGNIPCNDAPKAP